MIKLKHLSLFENFSNENLPELLHNNDFINKFKHLVNNFEDGYKVNPDTLVYTKNGTLV
jgi:hypothetical protein